MSDASSTEKHTLRNLENMSAPLPAMVDAQADFALNLLRDAGVNSSTILSPISISIALAMVYLGAKESTATQIRNTIAKDVSEEEIHAHFSSVLSLINSDNLNVTLESANRVYLQNDFKLRDSYVEGIKKYYAGELEEIDFKEASDAAAKINAFVAKSTHDKIKDLVSASSLDDMTRLVLINAIYFKGDWDKQFKEELTRDADFYSSPDNTKKVKMMSLESKFPYYENDNFQVVGLPYKSQQVTMYIILPRERFGLQNVINNMNASTLTQLLQKKGSTTVKVQLPRFKIESSFQLVDALKKLGITDAFEDNANFSGISANDSLKVSDVIHKAFIEVNEKGTEAAAATVVRMQNKMLRIPKDFCADQPFLFFVADEAHHIYFIGHHHSDLSTNEEGSEAAAESLFIPEDLQFIADHPYLFTNEEGSEAAAATSIQFQLTSAFMGKDETPSFITDHPFLYAIVDKHQQSVLFIGTIHKEGD